MRPETLYFSCSLDVVEHILIPGIVVVVLLLAAAVGVLVMLSRKRKKGKRSYHCHTHTVSAPAPVFCCICFSIYTSFFSPIHTMTHPVPESIT